eukprot:scaffold7191_cov120-Skeletonema_dohrnii-CCMP3373.AAC.1
MTLRVDGNDDLLALPPLHTTSYIDKGEASIIANREDKMCLETEFERYKALLVVVVSFELI